MDQSDGRGRPKGRIVFVLGHRGMLGAVVRRYLGERGHEILTSEARYRGEATDGLVQEVLGSRADAVVNCLGVTPASTASSGEMMAANALLPVHLSAVLGDRLLIHASTDCVFDGLRGWYRVDERPNATDPYGLSKLIGEACVRAPSVVVLRTSIVGPPARAGRGLLGWFLRQEDSVEGWTNHRWNGITTLAWAELASRTLEGHGLSPGLHHPTTPAAVTKEELLRMFGEVFERRVDVRPVRAARACDRTLVPTVTVAPLYAQLVELRSWMQR